MLNFEKLIKSNISDSEHVDKKFVAFYGETLEHEIVKILREQSEINFRVVDNIKAMVELKHLTHVILYLENSCSKEIILEYVKRIGVSKRYLIVGSINDMLFMKSLELEGLSYIHKDIDKKGLDAEVDFFINQNVESKYVRKSARNIYLIGAIGGVGVTSYGIKLAKKMASKNYNTILINHQYEKDAFVDVLEDNRYKSKKIENEDSLFETLDTATSVSLTNKVTSNLSFFSVYSDGLSLYGIDFYHKILPIINKLALVNDIAVHDVSSSVDFNYKELDYNSDDTVIVFLNRTIGGVRNANSILTNLNSTVGKLISVITDVKTGGGKSKRLTNEEIKKYLLDKQTIILDKNNYLNFINREDKLDALMKVINS